MRLLITDITEMHHEHICMAGWDIDQKRMVRPLPNSPHWSATLIKKHGFTTGNLYYFAPTNESLSGHFPHKTEDTSVHAFKIKSLPSPPQNWLSRTAPPTTATVDAAFQGHIHISRTYRERATAFVPHGCQTRSLWGLKIDAQYLRFYEDDGKLKAQLQDAERIYGLPVTCLALRDIWRNHGIDAINAHIPQQASLHVRLGLARAWSDHPNECFVMINGVFW